MPFLKITLFIITLNEQMIFFSLQIYTIVFNFLNDMIHEYPEQKTRIICLDANPWCKLCRWDVINPFSSNLPFSNVLELNDTYSVLF